MQAVVQDRYGSPDDVLSLEEIDKPVIGDDDVLVRVRAASVHPDVWHVVTGRPFALRLAGSGLRKPKQRVPGTDLAGQVESIGKNVTRLKPGDEVFGEIARSPWQNGGAFAESAAAQEDVLALKPKNVTFEQAASVPTSGYIALHNLRAADKLAGQNVLINGAGGGVGSIAVQVAKANGARVTGVDGAEKLAMIRSLGADQVIDFTKEDFTQRGERFDLIFDVASTLSLDDCKRVLTPNGVYVLIGHDHFGKASGRVLGSLPRILGLVARAPFDVHLRKPSFKVPSKQDTIAVLKTLLESGKLTPIIARTFPLSEVAGAMRCLQEGRAVGRIVITP